MNRIITVGREFGSGGREFGKRLAETLKVAYYDEEIIRAIAERSELARDYVNEIVENRIRTYYPITIGNTLAGVPGEAVYSVNREIYTAQHDTLVEMAEKSDCLIVGRCAGHILREMKPFRIFVYADMASRVARCLANGEAGEDLSEKALEKKIRSVDKARAQYYRFYTGHEWGERENYDLCINTSSGDLQALADMVAAYLQK